MNTSNFGPTSGPICCKSIESILGLKAALLIELGFAIPLLAISATMSLLATFFQRWAPIKCILSRRTSKYCGLPRRRWRTRHTCSSAYGLIATSAMTIRSKNGHRISTTKRLRFLVARRYALTRPAVPRPSVVRLSTVPNRFTKKFMKPMRGR